MTNGGGLSQLIAGAQHSKRFDHLEVAHTFGEINAGLYSHDGSSAARRLWSQLASEGHLSEKQPRVGRRLLRMVLAPTAPKVRTLRDTAARPDIGFLINPLHVSLASRSVLIRLPTRLVYF